MKRDMDLARRILLEIEDAPFTGAWVDLDIEDYAQEQVTYHVLLLTEAGLIEADDLSTLGGIDYRPTRLTWEGHEFLEASRNETTWTKAKALVTEKGGGMVFAVLQQVLIRMVEENVLGG